MMHYEYSVMDDDDDGFSWAWFAVYNLNLGANYKKKS